MPAVIDSFSGEYNFLSNFYDAGPLVFPEPDNPWGEPPRVWPTAEHAYQACKTLDQDAQEEIRQAETPGKAKRLGKKVELRDNWEHIKVHLMREILKVKFSKPALAEWLVDTYPATLIEGNNWGDTFWGVCNGVGENHLGKLLMEIRKDLMED